MIGSLQRQRPQKDLSLFDYVDIYLSEMVSDTNYQKGKKLTREQYREECINLLTYPHYWILTDVELEKRWSVDHSTINRWRKSARKRLRNDNGQISAARKAKMKELIENRERLLEDRDKNGKRQIRRLHGQEPPIDSMPTDESEGLVPLDKVWSHEDDFTMWLEENIDVLNDVIGLSLSVVGRKQAAGDFIVDLIAKDESRNRVVIENQLKQSDHDHLGKLITYLTVVDAKTAIWIVAKARDEHKRAICWLNESRSASFYLIELEAVQIGDASPVPRLKKILDPSGEGWKADEKEKLCQLEMPL